MKHVSRLLLNLFGWKFSNGIPPGLKKYVVAVAPHTSWKDFFLGIVIRSAMGRKIYYLAKKELFDSPVGFFFWWTGGRPVDRKNKTGLVDQVAKLFAGSPEFAIAVAPEGTRQKVQGFKTGFYYIARKAGVPIVACLFDYEHKEVRFLTPFYLTEDAEKDLDVLWSYFDEIKGAKIEGSISGKRNRGQQEAAR